MSKYRKAWIAGISLAALAALEVAKAELPLSPTWRAILSIAIAGVGTFATWKVPNEPTSSSES